MPSAAAVRLREVEHVGLHGARTVNRPAGEREGLPGADAVLTREQFGAWMFNHDEDVGGTVVKEIEFDPDEGGIVTGFGPVAEDLYNTWAEIGNRIADRKLREKSQ